MDLVLGVLSIAASFGLTVFLFIKSMKIIAVIDKERLKETRQILQRIKKR